MRILLLAALTMLVMGCFDAGDATTRYLSTQPPPIPTGFRAWITGSGVDPYAPLIGIGILCVFAGVVSLIVAIGLSSKLIGRVSIACFAAAFGVFIFRIFMGVVETLFKWGLVVGILGALLFGAFWAWAHVKKLEGWFGIDLNRDGTIGELPTPRPA